MQGPGGELRKNVIVSLRTDSKVDVSWLELEVVEEHRENTKMVLSRLKGQLIHEYFRVCDNSVRCEDNERSALMMKYKCKKIEPLF